MRPPALPLFLFGLAVSLAYFALVRAGVEAPWMAALKGVPVGTLALWAALQARGSDGRLIAAALAFGALGDVLLETHGLITGALAFLAGHLVATALYLRHRRTGRFGAAAIAVLVAVAAASLPADRPAPGIGVYSLGLGAMAGTAWFSRFPRATVGLGAALFVLSDFLIFARLGPLAGSPIPDWLVWPTYSAGQALIAWGVVRTLREGRA